MSVPKAMSIVTPDDKDTAINDAICESCAITVVPASNNSLYYYEGTEKGMYKKTDYSSTGLRAILLRKKKEVANAGREGVLIIRPGKLSSFKNLIDIIDESTIAMYKRYYVDKLTPAQEKLYQ